jgi:hypothetical protein
MKMMTTAATIAAVLVSAGAAMAAPVVPSTNPNVPSTAHHGQHTSNQPLKVARRHVERAIQTLQNDANDYGGHRVNAVDDLNAARQDLQQASNSGGNRNGRPIPIDNRNGSGNTGTPIPIDNRNGSGNTGTPIPIDNPNGSGNTGRDNENDGDSDDNNQVGNNHTRGQYGSNEDLGDVRQHIQTAIDVLNSDGQTYGGYKARAIDHLQAARNQIDDALQFVHRPGVQNGGSGQRVSDANLRFVDVHVRTAIGRLEQDRNDYGGHRAAAINDLQQARGYISSALAYDNSHGRGPGAQPVVPSTVVPGNVNTGVVPTNTLSSGTLQSNGLVTNDQTLADARQNIETAVDALKRDANDYGGFRIKAIGSLEAARSQLLQAMQYRHPR